MQESNKLNQCVTQYRYNIVSACDAKSEDPVLYIGEMSLAHHQKAINSKESRNRHSSEPLTFILGGAESHAIARNDEFPRGDTSTADSGVSSSISSSTLPLQSSEFRTKYRRQASN